RRRSPALSPRLCPAPAAYTHPCRHSYSFRPGRRRRNRRRQLEGEAGALPLARRDPDPTAHGGHQATGDEEPEPGPAAACAELGVGAAIELAEDLFLVRLRDTDPLVRDAHLDGVLTPAGAHGHRASIRRVAE